MNKRQKGNYYLKKTIDWLKTKGYEVAKTETIKMAWIKGRIIPIKTDIWGSDLMAKSETEFIFIQVKTDKSDTYKAKKEFNKTVWPPFIQRWVVRWPARSKSPVILKCEL